MRNLKRALSLGLTAAMISGLMVMGSSAASYADVTSEDNVEAIDVLEAVGIMIGDENGNFNPDQNVTRNEMAVVMSNLMEYNVASYRGTSPFTDVPSWAEPYVAACYTNGITAGTSATTYGGDQTVTTAQAALMLMKALGYFQYSSDFGSDWQLATVRQGNDIDLFMGVDSGVEQAMTRNDVAQLVLNTLEAGTVQASTNGSITVGGVTIATNVEYNFVTSNADYAYAISSAKSTDQNTDAQRSIVELGEQLYQGDLMKRIGEDDFGRPSSIWTYNNDEVGVYPDAATYTYTKAISEADLYDTLGNAIMQGNNNYNQLPYAWDIYYNGEALDENTTPKFKLPERNVDDDYLRTATGTLTEVFVDDENRHITLTMIDTFLAEVIRVNDDDDVTINYLGDKLANTYSRQITINLPGTTLAEGDKVLVNVYEDNNQFSIGAIELAETATGTVTAVKARYTDGTGKYAVMDDAQYDYVVNTFAADLADTELNDPTLNAENTLYLDRYGNMLAFEATERDVEYLYIQDAHNWLGGFQALATFAEDGREETINVTKVDTNNDPSIGDPGIKVPGVYAYVKQGSNYELTTLNDTHGGAAAVDQNVWANPSWSATGKNNYNEGASYTMTSGLIDDNIGTNDGTYGTGYAVSYSIKNGLNAIQADYTASGVATENVVATRNVVSLTNSTIFVDVEGGVVYTGYSNVPTMTDISFYVIYNKQLNADVVFITDGADNSTSDSFFMLTEKTPLARKGEDGTMYYDYEAWVNGALVTLTMKGTNDDITGADLKANVLYRIETITPNDEVTAASVVAKYYASFQTGYSYATEVTSGTIRLSSDANIAGCNFNTVTGLGQDIYAYNGDTIFMNVQLKADGTVDKVSRTSVGSINSTGDDMPGYNNVYVVAVDDEDAYAPVATLVYVVTPHQSTFASYIVTYPVAGEYPTNIAGVAVTDGNGNTVNDGASVMTGSTLNITATAASGYNAVIYVNGKQVGINTASIVTNGVTNITVAAQSNTIVSSDNMKIVLDESGSGTSSTPYEIYVFYTGSTAPSDAQVVNEVVRMLGITDFTNDVSQNASDTDFTARNGAWATYYQFTYANKVPSYKGTINGETVFISTSNAGLSTVATAGNSTLSSALTGTYVLQNSSNATGSITGGTPVSQNGSTYHQISAVSAAADGFNISTGYVGVSGDGITGTVVVPMNQAYNVPAKASVTSAKGTGFKYTISGADKYVAYGASIPAAALTADVTLDQDYITVDIQFAPSVTGWTEGSTTTSYIKVATAQNVQIVLNKAAHGLTTTPTGCKFTVSGGMTAAEAAFTTQTVTSVDVMTLAYTLNASSATDDIVITITAMSQS